MGEKENKVKLARIIASTVLLVVASLLNRAFDVSVRVQLLLFLPAYLVAGYDVLAEAGESIVRREAFDEDFLMSVATLGALLIGFVPGGEPEFAEAVFVMLFFQVGELFEDLATAYARAAHLADPELGVAIDETILGTAERALLDACERGERTVSAAIASGDFGAACEALAELREPIDRFFEDVLVMDEDTSARENRLRLLNRFANVFAGVANIGVLSKKK